jgi:sulfur relay (sulfurtransferase) DsrC/TusE family protein
MAKIDVNTIATFSNNESSNFEDFVDVFQNNIINLTKQQRYDMIDQDREYVLDDDGYIKGSVWSELIASELIKTNNMVPTIERLNALVEARAVFGQQTINTDYRIVAKRMNIKHKEFLKLFPKFPIVHLTRWGNLRKPTNLAELIANPVF